MWFIEKGWYIIIKGTVVEISLDLQFKKGDVSDAQRYERERSGKGRGTQKGNLKLRNHMELSFKYIFINPLLRVVWKFTFFYKWLLACSSACKMRTIFGWKIYSIKNPPIWCYIPPPKISVKETISAISSDPPCNM